MYLYDGVVYITYAEAEEVFLREHLFEYNIDVKNFIFKVSPETIAEHPEWVTAT
jgi:hypothetical protein